MSEREGGGGGEAVEGWRRQHQRTEGNAHARGAHWGSRQAGMAGGKGRKGREGKQRNEEKLGYSRVCGGRIVGAPPLPPHRMRGGGGAAAAGRVAWHAPARGEALSVTGGVGGSWQGRGRAAASGRAFECAGAARGATAPCAAWQPCCRCCRRWRAVALRAGCPKTAACAPARPATAAHCAAAAAPCASRPGTAAPPVAPGPGSAAWLDRPAVAGKGAGRSGVRGAEGSREQEAAARGAWGATAQLPSPRPPSCSWGTAAGPPLPARDCRQRPWHPEAAIAGPGSRARLGGGQGSPGSRASPSPPGDSPWSACPVVPPGCGSAGRRRGDKEAEIGTHAICSPWALPLPPQRT